MRRTVDFQAVEKVAGAISPVPGGCGPMTVTMLIKNLLAAHTTGSIKPNDNKRNPIQQFR